MDTFVARQPIFDRGRRLIGYELLHRSTGGNGSYTASDGSLASAQVISDSLFGNGLDKLVMGHLAFINFNRELLVQGYAELLPRELVVIEILESVSPDEGVLKECRKLKRLGYRIALDDYVDSDELQPLVACADIIKIDVQISGVVPPGQLVRRYELQGLKALAEKVETWEQFDRARLLGYTYFQGYFFARPELVVGKRASTTASHCSKLLEAIQQPDLDYFKIEQIIRGEVSFTYKLLRYMNSARFGRHEIGSIAQSLVLLGEEEIRRWGALLIICGLAENKSHELAVVALMRGRFCESLGRLAGIPNKGQALFLIGMFSLLDALLDRNLEEALAELSLDSEIAGALIGKQTDPRLRAIYGLVRSYETAEWDGVSQAAMSLGIAEELLPAVYAEAVDWSAAIFRGH